MRSPVVISLYYEGKQKDYEAEFYYRNSACRLKVAIDEKRVNFDGGINKSFTVSSQQENPDDLRSIDNAMLEALTKQMNRIFN